MLQHIAIKEGSGWKRYKSEEAVAPGNYYIVRQYMSAEARESFKTKLAPTAVQDYNGNFAWLLPYERWVKVVCDGQLPPELYLYGKVEDCNENRTQLSETLDLDRPLVDSMRVWQRNFLYDYLFATESNYQYRRAGICPVGAGKTVVGLAIAKQHDRPLVLAPTYCFNSWINEAKKWSLPCPRLSTYDSAHKQDPTDCLIMDEVLLAANPKTLRHEHALALSTPAKTVLGLTGTPQSCTPMDLRWLRAVYPGCVPGDEKPWRFTFGLDTKLEEIKPGQKAYVTKTWDQTRVSQFVAPYVRVVDKSEIQKDLPEIQFHRLTTPRPKQYELILKGAATERSKSKAIAQARQCTDGRIVSDDGHTAIRIGTDKLDLIEQLVGSVGEPVVIFARWQYMVADLAERLSDRVPAVLTGGGDHVSEVDRFTSAKTDVLIANACISQGMNLQERARIVIFVSNSMKPTDREQAIGRVYRPGQKRGVLVYDVVAENTLDGVALDLLTKHADKSEAFLEAALKKEFVKQCQV